MNYNYDSFIPKNFEPLMRWDGSPKVGDDAPDFPLWHAETKKETSLKEVWSAHPYTVVEFGSFT